MEGWNIQSFVFSLILPFLDTPQKQHDTMHYFVHRHHILDRAAAFKKKQKKTQLMATTDLSKSTGADTQISSRLEDNPFYEVRKLDLSTLGTC